MNYSFRKNTGGGKPSWRMHIDNATVLRDEEIISLICEKNKEIRPFEVEQTIANLREVVTEQLAHGNFFKLENFLSIKIKMKFVKNR